MNAASNAVMLQFLAWLSARPRTYGETMEAWRSSCPRYTVWEDALAEGLIQVDGGDIVRHAVVSLTPRGRVILDAALSGSG